MPCTVSDQPHAMYGANAVEGCLSPAWLKKEVDFGLPDVRDKYRQPNKPTYLLK